jgi:FAD/FMN-containing dehydrogenase
MLREKNPGVLIIGYGHIGDGNIHINICVKEGQKVEMTEGEIFQEVVGKGGSISAEHGVGIHKPQYLHLQKSEHILGIYRQIKNIFDPNGIMNPYKVIP